MALSARLALARFSIGLGLLFGWVAAAVPACQAESITIRHTDGRSLTGELDARTDGHRLWIRREANGMQLASGFAWEQVVSVRQGQKVYSGKEYSRIAASQASAAKAFLEIEPYAAHAAAAPAPSPAPGPADSSTSGADLAETPVSELLRRRQAQRRVASLAVEAYLGQWDADPQTDGLRVFIYPLSADGEIVPVHGQVDLSLLGEIEKFGLPPEFLELARTHAVVHERDFARGPAIVQLEFRQFHPDVELDVARQAVLHARLGISGQGVFAASDANVQLRTFSRARDQLQMHTRSRYFPQEHALPPVR